MADRIKNMMESALKEGKFPNKIQLYDWPEDGLDDLQWEMESNDLKAGVEWALEKKGGKQFFLYSNKVAKSNKVKDFIQTMLDDEAEMSK